MAPVTINGYTLYPDPREDGRPSEWVSEDVQHTNYICMQGYDLVNDEQKEQLGGLGVSIQRYVGSNTYLCRYSLKELEPLRELPFVRYVNTYDIDFKISASLRKLLQRERSARVTIYLHEGARESQEFAKDLVGIPGVHRSSVSFATLRVVANISAQGSQDPVLPDEDDDRLEVGKLLWRIAKLDDVRHIQYKSSYEV